MVKINPPIQHDSTTIIDSVTLNGAYGRANENIEKMGEKIFTKDEFCFEYTISIYNDNINIKELYNFKISVILTIGTRWHFFEKLSYCPSSIRCKWISVKEIVASEINSQVIYCYISYFKLI